MEKKTPQKKPASSLEPRRWLGPLSAAVGILVGTLALTRGVLIPAAIEDQLRPVIRAELDRRPVHPDAVTRREFDFVRAALERIELRLAEKK